MTDVKRTMTQQEGEAHIREIKIRIEALITEAVKISEASGAEFFFEPSHIGTYYPTGYEEAYPGHWNPSEWNSSSIYC